MATFKASGLYEGYLKNVQRIYEREPVLQASLQVILSIFTVAFFIFFAIRPTLSTVSTLVRKIDDQKLVNGKLDSKIQQLAIAQDNLTIYGERLNDQLDEAIPKRPDVDRLARQIEAISIESEAYITSLNIQESPLVGEKTTIIKTAGKSEGEQFVVFSFAAGGSQEQIRSFISLLEKMERGVMITQLSIKGAETSQKENFTLMAEGKATIYYLPEKK